jgi:hypothetical protein
VLSLSFYLVQGGVVVGVGLWGLVGILDTLWILVEFLYRWNLVEFLGAGWISVEILG